MKIVTHNDRFHADDVFALAVIRIRFGDEITEVIRSRDEKIIESGDIVFDVGGVNDPDKNRFDHHQIEGGGKRENGFPFPAFGLVWKKWGEDICESKEAAEILDKKVVQPIDANDNGYAFYEYNQDDVREYVPDVFLMSFGATWKEEENYDKAYLEAVDIAEKILRREIILAKHKAEAIPIVEKIYEDSKDKRLVVLEDYLPWSGVIKDHEEVLYVISPTKDKSKWRINCVQEKGFQNRKDLPKEWAGLRDKDLENITGVEGVIFCHRGLFVSYTKTKEAALQLAQKALDY